MEAPRQRHGGTTKAPYSSKSTWPVANRRHGVGTAATTTAAGAAAYLAAAATASQRTRDCALGSFSGDFHHRLQEKDWHRGHCCRRRRRRLHCRDHHRLAAEHPGAIGDIAATARYAAPRLTPTPPVDIYVYNCARAQINEMPRKMVMQVGYILKGPLHECTEKKGVRRQRKGAFMVSLRCFHGIPWRCHGGSMVFACFHRLPWCLL